MVIAFIADGSLSTGSRRPVLWHTDAVGAVHPICRDMIVAGLATERFTVVDFKGSHFEREIVLWGVRLVCGAPDQLPPA